MAEAADFDSNEEVYEVDRIIDVRLDEIGRYRLYKVRWKGCGSDDDTWEPRDNLLTCDELLQQFERDRNERNKRKKLKKKKKKHDLQPLIVKSEPKSDSDVEEERKKNKKHNKSTHSNLTSPVSSHASTNSDDFDLTGMTRKQRKQYQDAMESSRQEAERYKKNTDHASLKRKDDVVSKEKQKLKNQKAGHIVDQDSDCSGDIVVKKKRKYCVIDDLSESETSTTNKKASDILDEIYSDQKKENSNMAENLPKKVVVASTRSSKSPVKTDTYVPLVAQLYEKTENTIVHPSPDKKRTLFNNVGNQLNTTFDRDSENLAVKSVTLNSQKTKQRLSNLSELIRRPQLQAVLSQISLSQPRQSILPATNFATFNEDVPISSVTKANSVTTIATVASAPTTSTSTVKVSECHSKEKLVVEKGNTETIATKVATNVIDKTTVVPGKKVTERQKSVTKAKEKTINVPQLNISAKSSSNVSSTQSKQQTLQKPSEVNIKIKNDKQPKEKLIQKQGSANNLQKQSQQGVNHKQEIAQMHSEINKQSKKDSERHAKQKQDNCKTIDRATKQQVLQTPKNTQNTKDCKKQNMMKQDKNKLNDHATDKKTKPTILKADKALKPVTQMSDNIDFTMNSSKPLNHNTDYSSKHKSSSSSADATKISKQASSSKFQTSDAAAAAAITPMSQDVSVKKVSLHKSISSPVIPTLVQSQDSSLPAKDKSRKLSYLEYRAKKRSTSDDGGLFLEFTKLPNADTIAAKMTTNSIDKTTVIPSKKVIERQMSIGKGKEKTFSVPQFNKSANVEVLSNILESMEVPADNENEQISNKNNGKSNKSVDVQTEAVSHNVTESEDDDILKEDPDEDGDIETDLDDYSGDEDGMENGCTCKSQCSIKRKAAAHLGCLCEGEGKLCGVNCKCGSMKKPCANKPLMFVDNGNAKQSHLLLPGANTIVLDNLTIHQAILQGDSATVTQCKINENVINEHMRDGETLLMKALRECAPNIVQILLEKGADPNRATPKGVTPLMVAVDVDLQQKGLVSLLIKNHAKLNLQKENGETALIMACNKGHLEIIHLLLNSGADVKPALTYLEKNIDKLVRVPLHLRPVLQHALNTHAERFREITETMLKALLDSNKMRLGTALMSCRCISPNELEEHDFYFKCDVNASEPRINVVMLALPVMFEKDGGININFEAIDRAVNEVYLNNEEPVAVLPGSKSLYFLFPDIGQVNILKIKTTCPYKVLLCVYELTYGTITQPQKQIQSVPQVPVH